MDDTAEDTAPEDTAPEDEEPDERPDPPRRRIGARAAARAAVEQIAEMTGRAPEGVTFVRKQDDSWLVGVEVVETERIPDSSDVLAVYEAELDDEAELMSYQRVRRYPRGRGDDD
ncbi:gas vesicle protein [Pseudonocardia sp. TMWB2A]